jgi:hypothetical protein
MTIELKNNRLFLSFPEIHPDAKCEIEFQRTLRIPDDGKDYSLPPGFGAFPARKVEDFAAKLDPKDVARGGILIPMYQSEALWVKFLPVRAQNRAGAYPFAVKIAAGKRSAVTGKAFEAGLPEGDYVTVPKQPWVDGFSVGNGVIRQFVAAPLGMGVTVEEQLTGEAEFGGLQIEAFPMKADEYEKRFPVISRPNLESFGMRSYSATLGATRSSSAGPAGMGMAAGGRMKQQIFPDPFGREVWANVSSRSFVHIHNSLVWRQITGENPPTTPRTAAEYAAANLPWFDYYADGGTAPATEHTNKIKGLAELEKEKGVVILPENQSIEVDPKKVVVLGKKPNEISSGDW